MSSPSKEPSNTRARGWKRVLPLTQNSRMLWGIVLGIALGIGSRAIFGDSSGLEWALENVIGPIGQIFLRLLFMLVVPLLFAALVAGVSELELKTLGRIGWKTLAYTAIVSSISVVIGVALVNILRPGDATSTDALEGLLASTATSSLQAPVEGTPAEVVVSMVPDNVVRAAAEGDMIGFILFTLAFGAALAGLRSDNAQMLRDVVAGLYEVMMRLIDWVLRLAPLGVGALLFAMGARLGLDLLVQLAAYVGVVVLGLGLHMFGVYSLAVWLIGKRTPLSFFRGVRLALVTAFSTSSSAASLPTALKVADEELRLPGHVSRFVLTAGAAMNQNGTALFEGVTVLFLAQLFDVELGLGQQLVVMGISILGGIGTAGVPSASLPVLAVILAMFGIPVEGLALILGVDRLLDMCRTTVNVIGDLVVATCVARGEEASPDPVDTQLPVEPS